MKKHARKSVTEQDTARDLTDKAVLCTELCAIRETPFGLQELRSLLEVPRALCCCLQQSDILCA